MPRIFDNIELGLLPALKQALELSRRADFCVGYFNLRGWRLIDKLIEAWPGGPGACCRLLVGMHQLPHDELRSGLSLPPDDGVIDRQTALRLKKRMTDEFRQQLVFGAPNNQDEAGLRRLSRQLKAGKLIVKLHLRHPLHAKLYLVHRADPVNPSIAFVGSSNLTLAGLSKQGELNVDVLDHDACNKLQRWFDERWDDGRCWDISSELAEIIDASWAREELLSPYHIYLKIAYHLSQEARAGLAEFRLPREFGNLLLDFQVAAVKIAAHHLNKRGGVLLGDVVGLGKTLMATALAKMFQEDQQTETLIICPKNLVRMWEDHVERFRLYARVVSLSRVIGELPDLRRYRVVLIDESHNLRNREGKRFRAIQEYIERNESRCVLLSATPYNKSYLDLSAQLRLFVPEDKDLGVRPERQLRDIGETEFVRRHQCPIRSLAAFEKSTYADDWRDLMRLYLVRRTRSFIEENYAQWDEVTGRRYLTLEGGVPFYFPARVPRTVKFTIDDSDPNDQYALLYSASVVSAINGLQLPRYGLGNYVVSKPDQPPTQAESRVLAGLSRAGWRLKGFCRTNLFKRLESGGPAFVQSIERHILRNFVFVHAIDQGLPLPIGPQGAELLDPDTHDEDDETPSLDLFDIEEGTEEVEVDEESIAGSSSLRSEADFRARAAAVYEEYSQQLKGRFKWLRPVLFLDDLRAHLLADARALIEVLARCGDWDPARDAKLAALANLLMYQHPDEKVLVFTQFADTVRYLRAQLKARGLGALEGVTGLSADPTALAWRFSPVSNAKLDQVQPADELRVLVATDVLSEGQNLQDCAIIVNYDLPWAIIRLIQRAGRVDRIGQQAPEIRCYSFLPADGVERIINLRSRVRQRLRQNAEVVGSDETFFEDDSGGQRLVDLYHEKAGILDGDVDNEVDLASYAYQIWKNATDRDPRLKGIVEELPDVVYSSRSHEPAPDRPEGVLLYLRTAEGADSLAWIDEDGQSVTQSQLAILQAAECDPDTPPIPRHERHHELVQIGVEHLVEQEQQVGGGLGRPSGARFKTYDRLTGYLRRLGSHRDLFVDDAFVHSVERAIDEIYRFPLQQSAIDTLNRQLRSGIGDEELARLTVALREDGRLAHVDEEAQTQEPRIICSLGLYRPAGGP